MTTTAPAPSRTEPQRPPVLTLRAVRRRLQLFADEAEAIAAGKFDADTEPIGGEFGTSVRTAHLHLGVKAREVVRRTHTLLSQLREAESTHLVEYWITDDEYPEHHIIRGYD